MKRLLSVSIITAIVVLLGVFFLKENTGLVQIDTKSISNTINDKREHAIYFGRPTCPYCKIVQPELKELAEKYHTKLYYYNTDKEKKANKKATTSILQKLEVETVPTVIIVKDGKVKHSYSGTEELDKIQKYLNSHKFNIF